MGLHVDHIIYAVRDLEASASRFGFDAGISPDAGG